MTLPDTPAAAPLPAPNAADDRRARDRFAILSGLRIAGVVQMGLALWMGLGGSLFGHYGFGTILFVHGALDAFVFPAFLARRWRTRR